MYILIVTPELYFIYLRVSLEKCWASVAALPALNAPSPANWFADSQTNPAAADVSVLALVSNIEVKMSRNLFFGTTSVRSILIGSARTRTHWLPGI